jgi:hypothetical protein
VALTLIRLAVTERVVETGGKYTLEQTADALIGIRGGRAHHATKAATSSPRRALPRRRALCTSWKKAR